MNKIMDEKQKRILQYSTMLTAQIFEMFQEEDCENYLGDREVNSVEFGMALMHANCSIFKTLFGETNVNLLEASHMCNSLAVEYLMQYGKISKQDDEESDDE